MDRIILGSAKLTVENTFKNGLKSGYKPIYNGHSGSTFPVCTGQPGTFEHLNWGLYDKKNRKTRYFISQDELTTDKTFKNYLEHRKCLIPANAISFRFHDQRFLIHSKMFRLFGLAGIYSSDGFAVLTKKSICIFRTFDQAQEPIILNPIQYDQWFNLYAHLWIFMDFSEQLKLKSIQISTEMNDENKNHKDLLKPVKTEEDFSGYNRNRFKSTTVNHWGDSAIQANIKDEKK